MNRKYIYAGLSLLLFLTVDFFACPTCIGRLQLNDPPFFIDKHYEKDSEWYDTSTEDQINQDSEEKNMHDSVAHQKRST